jgi:hypothetical protein
VDIVRPVEESVCVTRWQHISFGSQMFHKALQRTRLHGPVLLSHHEEWIAVTVRYEISSDVNGTSRESTGADWLDGLSF